MGIPKETLVYYYLAEWHSGSYNGLRLAASLSGRAQLFVVSTAVDKSWAEACHAGACRV